MEDNEVSYYDWMDAWPGAKKAAEIIRSLEPDDSAETSTKPVVAAAVLIAATGVAGAIAGALVTRWRARQ